MKINNILKSIAAVAAGVLLAGCQQTEQDTEARAVAAGETYLVFEARNAAEQEVSVYADGDWAVDVDSEWIEVSPMTGTGMGSITVKVTDNLATGGVDNLPRNGKITIQGGTALRNAVITVHQNGDTYFGVKEYTLAELADLDDETVGKLSNMDVVAVTKGGFILEQSGKRVFVQGAREVKAGDVVSLNGKKKTIYGNPGFEVDEVKVLQSKEIVYPTATDLTAQLGSYDGSILFCSLKGSLVNGVLKVGSASVQILDPIDALGLDAVDLHKVAVSGYAVGKSGSTGYFVAVSVADEGADESLVPYPLKWAIGKDLNYSNATFNNDNPRIDPVQGIGYIEYVPYDLEHTNDQNNYKLDVSGNNPRVTGPWVNDYWLFYGNGAIKAGTDVEIAFEMRSSKWGQKFWLLEYLDGDQWLPAGEPQSSTEPGEEVFYTCATNIDGATNQPVMETIHFRKNNDHLQIRLRCVVNWRGGGDPMSPCRSTASSRLSITNVDDDTYRPHVTILKEGDGVEKDPVTANIEVSTELLTFNGTPDGPKTIKVTSDYDFTISTTADWLSFDKEGGAAGEETEIAVTCQQSELSELRQGTIKIVSEDSSVIVNVVQSAAGQMLDPFISISSANNLELDAEAGSKSVRIQSNVEVSFATEASWITITPVETKALVEWTEYMLEYEANESETPREAVVRFYNEENGAQALLIVTQKGFEPVLENNLIQWGFSPDISDTYKASFVDDNAFKANIAGTGTLTWNSLAENIALDVNSKKGRAVTGAEGHPYVTGVWPGDYWLFTIPLKNVSAGDEISFKGYHQASATGQKYWKMEYSIDGTSWYPVKELQTESETGTNAKYTHKIDVAGAPVLVEESVVVPMAIPEATLQIRFTCVANWQQKGGTLAAPNGGTHRWAGDIDNGPTVKIGAPEVGPGPGPGIENAKVGDVLWEEWWLGATVNQKPSAYAISSTRGTVAFGDVDIAYTEFTPDGGSATSIKEDGLVYYNSAGNIADEKYKYNLLVSKKNGYLDADSIPCPGVKTAIFTYRSNTKVDVQKVSSATTGVSISELSGSQVNKLDVDDSAAKYTNTITCTVTIPEGTEKLNLRIENTSSGSNIRVDGIELKVTEVY